ncbi:LuxR family two component transcriptional regulator [Algoriphagus boseongensis]|uniref:LuxR family two component transcriptional regulator n=1 Tax=Algoriphagus boseongensis TaxID=1442587 RepID=A0A4V6PW50_9BACT|nr:response regulator transcription factor [Algoriphagus boseongensis]TDQ17220.1 LuxR family two component transcriptional regulator [Algoriphagus boseongensis]
MKLLLVDDHKILLDGLKFLLLNSDGITEVQTSESVEDAFRIWKIEQPDLVISDISVPKEGGIALAKMIKKENPRAKVIFLSMHEEPYIVKEALATGVDGYVLKKAAHQELLKAVREVSEGQLFFSAEIQKILIQRMRFPEDERILTSREKEVLDLIFDELSNKEIGEKLHISERTVETHRKNIYQKTKTNSLVGLLKFAIENNLISGLN